MALFFHSWVSIDHIQICRDIRTPTTRAVRNLKLNALPKGASNSLLSNCRTATYPAEPELSIQHSYTSTTRADLNEEQRFFLAQSILYCLSEHSNMLLWNRCRSFCQSSETSNTPSRWAQHLCDYKGLLQQFARPPAPDCVRWSCTTRNERHKGRRGGASWRGR